jgi:hypothetical protein
MHSRMRGEIMVHYWTLVGPAGEVAICQLVRGSHGLEVHCTLPESERVLRSSDVKTQHDGFNVSEEWRAAYAARGWRPETSS